MITTALSEKSRALIILLAVSLLSFPLIDQEAEAPLESTVTVTSCASRPLLSGFLSKRKSTQPGSHHLTIDQAASELEPDESDNAVRSDVFAFSYELCSYLDQLWASRSPCAERRASAPTRLMRLEILRC